MILLSANNALTTLAAGISSSATVITLATGTGVLFPTLVANEYFTLTLNDQATGQLYEVCWCTARTGDSLTVIRGQEGSTARAWLLGDFAYNTLTAVSESTGRAFSWSNVPTLPFTIPSAHQGITQLCGTTGTITLPSVSGIQDGFFCTIVCTSASATITVNTNSATVWLPSGSTTTTFSLGGLQTSIFLQWNAAASAWYSMGSSTGTAGLSGFPTGYAAVSTTGTIAASNVGNYIAVSGTATVQTIAATGWTVGAPIGFLAVTACTLAIAGGGTFRGGLISGDTSISMPGGSWICVQWDGTHWIIFSASPNFYETFSPTNPAVSTQTITGNSSPSLTTPVTVIFCAIGSGPYTLTLPSPVASPYYEVNILAYGSSANNGPAVTLTSAISSGFYGFNLGGTGNLARTSLTVAATLGGLCTVKSDGIHWILTALQVGNASYSPDGTEGSCFLSWAQVEMFDGTFKQIADVRVGEWVKDRYGLPTPVLALHRPMLGGHQACIVNGHHVTTTDHPFWTARGPAALDPQAIMAGWNIGLVAVIGPNGPEHRVNVGLKRRIEQLVIGDVVPCDGRAVRIDSVEMIDLPADTQLYNLVLGGSHTMRVDGFVVTGWPREDDWNYEAWAPMASTAPMDERIAVYARSV